MSLLNMLAETAEWRRLTNVLSAPAAVPFTATLTRTDVQPIYIEFRITGLTGTVTVLITGSLNATPQTETVTLLTSSPPTMRSTKAWTAITSIVASGTTAGTVGANAVYADNNLATTETVLSTTMKGRKRQPRLPPDLQSAPQGTQLISRFYWYTNTFGLRPLDILIIAGTRYEVEHAQTLYDRTAAHHTRALIKELQSAS